MGSYAMGGTPWGWSGADCDPVSRLRRAGWFAAMSGSRRSAPAFGGWAAFPGAAFGGPWSAGGPGWRGTKARRGDVRAAILGVLADEALNGYQVIQQIAERTGGAWKPSPGSIYPTLQQLEDEGLVEADAAGGRRTFRLTDAGRAYVAEHAEEVAAPWESMAEGEGRDEPLKPLLAQVAAAVWQVMAVGSAEQQERARGALLEFRRRLYGILSDDGQSGDDRR